MNHTCPLTGHASPHSPQIVGQVQCRSAVRVDKSSLYAQAYAKALVDHGHVARVHIKSGREAHANRRQICEARHAAVQKKMATTAPFPLAAFLKADPWPKDETPDEVVGYSATPKYMRQACDFQPVWFMDVGGGRSNNPLNFFNICGVDGNHHVHPFYDTFIGACESEESWTPLLEQAKVVVPKLDDSQTRLVKDNHKGSHQAAIKVMPHCVPFSCSVHQRKHYQNDASWGAWPVRQELLVFYDTVLRNPNLESVLAHMNDFKNKPTTSATYNKFKKTAMEYLIPVMRHCPTSLGRQRGQESPGPLFGEVTSNAAEVTMHMMLPVRKEGNIATSQVGMHAKPHVSTCPTCKPHSSCTVNIACNLCTQVMYWQLRQRRWRKILMKLRSAQQVDKSLEPQRQGLTPYVLKKVTLAEIKARRTCAVKPESWSGLKCEVSSSTRHGVWHAVDLSNPKDRTQLCSNGCMHSRAGFCPHVVAALMQQPTLKYCDYLPEWQTLLGWANQLGVDPESAELDHAVFTLPTESEVLAIMREDQTLNRNALPPSSRGIGSKNVGRIKGTVEEHQKRLKRLEKEIGQGKLPGIPGIDGTTPVKSWKNVTLTLT